MGEKQEASTQTCVVRSVTLALPGSPMTMEASTRTGLTGQEEIAAQLSPADPARLAGSASPRSLPSVPDWEVVREEEQKEGQMIRHPRSSRRKGRAPERVEEGGSLSLGKVVTADGGLATG